jgi:hypothetical protein
MHLLRWLVASVVVPLAFTVPWVFTQAANASIGVGVQSQPVKLSATAHAGGTYGLPALYVVNSGTQSESVSVRVRRLSSGSGRLIPPSWIQPAGQSVRLDPGKSARIPLQIVVPGTAAQGQYTSDLVAVASAGISAGRANFGVAAATRLEFRVGPGAAAQGFLPPWVPWTMAGLILLGIVIFLLGRLGLRLPIERATAWLSADRSAGGENVT